MNILDIYVSEVGRHLPNKNRTDIEAEIRSALQDLLEDRSRNIGKPIDDEMIYSVVKEYGDPEKVAASYQGDRYLIGPQLYPVFLKVIRIVFPAIAILAGIVAVVQASQRALYVDQMLGGFGGSIFSLFALVFGTVVTTVISTLGYIVLIFIIIEWVMRNEGMTLKSKLHPIFKEWDPHSLDRISLPDQAKLSKTVIEIVGCFAAIVIFNFYPQIISFGFSSGGQWYIGVGNLPYTPLLSEAFFHVIPFLTVIWALTILLDIVLLRLGYWNKMTRIISIGLKFVGILITTSLLVGPSLIGVTAASLISSGIAVPGDAGTFVNILNQIVHIALALAIFLGGLEIIVEIIRTFRATTLRNAK